MGPNQSYKESFSVRGNHKQNEKINTDWVENFTKQCDQQVPLITSSSIQLNDKKPKQLN